MRQLATIQTIADVQPIEGADSIEKVKVKEWWCVAKKGEFKINDLCVYFEIDSLLPESNPAFSFLEKGAKKKSMTIDGKTYTGYRLKTIKLRGQISQGLALPVNITGVPGWTVIGDDVSRELEVVKYEAPIPAELAGKIKGSFPSFIPKTDEERIQNCAHLIKDHVGQVFYVTEKLDGSSATFYKKDGVFGVCSRNLDLLETEGNTFWKIARELKIEEKLSDNMAIQGELVGPGIQGNPLRLPNHDLFVYNLFDISKQRYADVPDLKLFCINAEIKMVPIVHPWYEFDLDLTVEELIKSADGKSLINTDADREGLVIRPHVEVSVTIGKNENQRFSFKVISNNYLLNEK